MNSGVVDGSTTVVSICANNRAASCSAAAAPGSDVSGSSGSFQKFPEVFRVRRNRVAAMPLPRRARPQCGMALVRRGMALVRRGMALVRRGMALVRRGMALVRRCTDLELAARVRHGVGTQGYSGY